MNHSKLGAEERIRLLLEEGTFVETGGRVLARNTDYNLPAKKAPGDGVITGYGVIGDRMVCVYSQDASVLGGSVGEMHARKIEALYDMAMKTGAPIIGMIDCAGLRLQEANDALNAFGVLFKKQAQASGKIPQLCGVFGKCGGGSALMAALSDFVFMEKNNGELFISSPNALLGNNQSKLDTSGWEYQAVTAGNVDFVCDGEEELLAKMREVVLFLPSDYEADDAFVECKDDLNRIIPELAASEYDARYLLKMISDDFSMTEIKEMYGGDMVTALIRLNGETVGAVANQGEDGKKLLTGNGLAKAAKFIRFCDAFSIPLLTITDTEGMKATVDEERQAAGAMAKFTAVLAESTVPRVNLITGKAFGTAASVMNSKAVGADFVLAWPDAKIGMMDAQQAVRIMYADEISASADSLSLIREKAAAYQELQSSALAAAQRGYVDDIIEPDATRKRLIAALEMLAGKKVICPDKKHASI